jgi:hypothetical protein
MKVGDLVRHRFDGRWDEVGVILKITLCVGVHPGGMASVLWSPSHTTHCSDRLYRTRDLEAINESR